MKQLYLPLLLSQLFPTVALTQEADKIQSQTGFKSINEPLEAIVIFLIAFLPTVAAIYLAISGYRYITAQGNPELVETAKRSLLYAVAGLFIALVSVAVITTVARQLGFEVLP